MSGDMVVKKTRGITHHPVARSPLGAADYRPPPNEPVLFQPPERPSEAPETAESGETPDVAEPRAAAGLRETGPVPGRSVPRPAYVLSANAWVEAVRATIDSLPEVDAGLRSTAITADEYRLAEALTPEQRTEAWAELATAGIGIGFPQPPAGGRDTGTDTESATGDAGDRGPAARGYLAPRWYEAIMLHLTGETRFNVNARAGNFVSQCRIALSRGRSICVNRRRTVTDLDDGTELVTGISPTIEIQLSRESEVWEALTNLLPDSLALRTPATAAPLASDGEPLELDSSSYSVLQAMIANNQFVTAGQVLRSLNLPPDFEPILRRPEATILVTMNVRSGRGLPDHPERSLNWGGVWVQTAQGLYAVQLKDHISRNPVVQIRTVQRGHLARELFFALVIAHEYLRPAPVEQENPWRWQALR